MRNLLLMLVIAALALTGCKKEQPPAPAAEPATADEPTKAEPTKAEPTKAAEPAKAAEPTKADEAKAKADEQGTEPKGDEAKAAAGDPEKDCGALYDFAQQMRAALAKKFGKGKATKPMPPREKFITACKTLPPEVVRCMNPKTQMAEPKKCKETLKKAQETNKEAIAKFQAMMK